MTILDLLNLSAFMLAAVLLPGLIHLTVLTIAALRPRKAADVQPWTGRLRIVVPAHNEAANLRYPVLQLAEAAVQDGNTELLVVADNCDDDTAAVARMAGAQVAERNDPAVRGKGAALRFGFARSSRAEWFIVVDADTRIDAGFLPAMRRAIARADSDPATVALQAAYVGDVPAQATGRAAMRARLVSVAMMAFNVLRPRARHALGASCGVLGNGFAVRASAVRNGGWGSDAIVEDADQHLRWQAAGLRVDFVEDAIVHGELPLAGAGARSQRARWEGGRLALARHWLPRLARALLRGRAWALEPAADLLLPPLGHLAAALALLALLPPAPTRGLALAGFLLLALHVTIALRVGRATRSQARALLLAPWYVLWKLGQLTSTLRSALGRDGWIRTVRNPQSPS